MKRRLIFATNNLNKLREVRALLPENFQILGLEDIGCQADIPETRPTISGNAIQKAEFVFKNFGLECFADDTGLEIDALEGAPGVYSARYAGPEKNAQANMEKVLLNMKGVKDRRARFITVIALKLETGIHTFKGICEGHILQDKTGKKGFGYDPIFVPQGYDQSFAEMDLSLKNKISHRALAINQLVDFLKTMMS